MNVGTFEDMMQDFRNGTYDLTEDGKCTGCGSCCSNLLPMTDSEIQTIHRYIKANGIKERKCVFPVVKPLLDMTCPFLMNDKANEKCAIYSVRPDVCRKFSCDPSKRANLDKSYAGKVKIVNVRSEFYGTRH